MKKKIASGISSNLIEGIVVDKAGNKAKTLGDALLQCGTLFPHDSIAEVLKNIYKFSSDYPNIRHTGSTSNSRRDLKKDDALLVTALNIIFSSYVSSDDDGLKLLIGEF